MKKWLIFTDLDGTLLDHDDYNYGQARPALEKIRQLQIPLIINSSKTFAEIDSICKSLHNNSAFAVENGAAVFFPAKLFKGYDEPINKVILGRPIEEILHSLHSLRKQYGFLFKGFSDYSVTDVIQETGLSEIQASQAKQRLATEPIKWLDSDEKLTQFERLLREYDLQLIRGGRFLHVMGHNDKALAMAWLLNKYQERQATDLLTIALGDSQNDRKMLEQADYAGVIRRLDGSCLELKKKADRVFYSQHPAPLGWQEVMDRLFSLLIRGEKNE